MLFDSPSQPRAPPPAPPLLVAPLKSAPWCRRPFLLHGSCLRWLHVCHRNGCGQGHAWLLLFRLPLFSSLAPPSSVASLDSLSTRYPCLPAPPVARRTFREGGGRGGNVTPLDCFCCVFAPHFLPVTKFLPHVDSRCLLLFLVPVVMSPIPLC